MRKVMICCLVSFAISSSVVAQLYPNRTAIVLQLKVRRGGPNRKAIRFEHNSRVGLIRELAGPLGLKWIYEAQIAPWWQFLIRMGLLRIIGGIAWSSGDAWSASLSFIESNQHHWHMHLSWLNCRESSLAQTQFVNQYLQQPKDTVLLEFCQCSGDHLQWILLIELSWIKSC